MPDTRLQGRYRAGVIGHTGRGNYGHGLDMAFVDLPGVQLVAVADPDDAGCGRAMARTGAERGYADYREMLAQEQLDLVAVSPRWLDQHATMVIAAAQAGVRAIYCEKPLARSLEEADRMLNACARSGTKLAVGFQNRAMPAPRLAQQLISDGKIGRLRTLRAFGKQDERGGGQDLLVLGPHLLDLMRLFAGDARWCNARVTQAGRDVTAADAVPAAEEGGWIAGDDIVAQYGFDRGVTGAFQSVKSDDGGGNPYFRIELGGTGGVLTFWSGADSPVYTFPGPFAGPDRGGEWERLQPEPPAGANGHDGTHAANQAIVRDLLAAVESGGQPLSSGNDARAALEMALAAYESHRRGERIALPLANREHPLLTWQRGNQGA
ncbi:MAG: Gfo/Idh/MocA family protein [Chloroflexota bacterium]